MLKSSYSEHPIHVGKDTYESLTQCEKCQPAQAAHAAHVCVRRGFNAGDSRLLIEGLQRIRSTSRAITPASSTQSIRLVTKRAPRLQQLHLLLLTSRVFSNLGTLLFAES